MKTQYWNKKEGNRMIALLAGIALCLLIIPFANATSWWNVEWKYRIPLEINSSFYSRVDWPIEFDVNFTSILSNAGDSHAFDVNSTRVFEYNSSGSIIREVSSQFDRGDYFNESTNAIGTIVFLMNGTTGGNKTRHYEIYFDTNERNKNQTNYPTNLTFGGGQGAEEFNVNTSIGTKGLRWYFDTKRGENASGMYKVQDQISNNIFNIPGSNENPIEYTQYTNGTYNYSFDLRNQTTFKYTGPIRVVVEQTGNETLWSLIQNLTEGRITKRYIFYAENQWIKVEQNFTNTADYEITRGSTAAGALAIDIARAGLYGDVAEGNSSNPGSWWWFPNPIPISRHIGIINVNSSSGFFADNQSEAGRGGIHLSSLLIPAKGSLWDIAALHFNSPVDIGGSSSETQISDLRNRFTSPANITQQPLEAWSVMTDTSADFLIYNRGEDGKVTVNATYDPDRYVSKINATFTTSSGDNQTLILYDDGTHGDAVSGDKNFTNYFNLSINSTLGVWDITAYAYNTEGFFLNKSTKSFNVSGTYNVTTVILNPNGLVNRTINFSLEIKNHRTDRWISNALLNCSWGNTLLDSNYTNGNGTYFLNFTAPGDFGLYIINCSVNKSGNLGSDTDFFVAEAFSTFLNINFTFAVPGWTAENITLLDSQSFEAFVNASNIGNSTAYDTNLTLRLPPGWTSNSTFESLWNITIGGSLTKMFLITIPSSTIPGIYLVNATANWSNSAAAQGDASGTLNVTVASNPHINVSENFISGITPAGQTTILGNFIIDSIGNDALTSVTFNVGEFTWSGNVNFTFLPISISSLPMGNSSSIQVSIILPISHPRGFFTGILNITSGNDGSDNLTIDIMVPETNLSISPAPQNFVINNMRWYEYRNFTVSLNTTNTGNVTAYEVNISASLPPYWNTNYTDNIAYCGDMLSGQTCSRSFIILASRTLAGNYSVNLTSQWTNPGVGVASNQTSINISVGNNPEFIMNETFIAGNAEHGTESFVNNFTLISTGNANISLDSYTINGFSSNFSFTFFPSIAQFSTLQPGQNKTINLNATVDLAFAPGTYNGTINISSVENGSRIVKLNVTVPANRTWLMSTLPLECTRVLWYDEGIVCNITITNTGNSLINFTINISQTNWQNTINITWVNQTIFSVPKQSSHTLSVYWNVTHLVKSFYNTNYTINATSQGTPKNRTVTISLQPYSAPIVNITFDSAVLQQSDSISISANITDTSGAGIAWAKINITRPSGMIDSGDMTLVGNDSSNFTYNVSYPSVWGDTTAVGFYNVSIYAMDAAGMTGESNRSFYVAPVLNVTNTQTGWTDYFIGESGSAYCNVTDLFGSPFISNVTVTVYDSANNIRFNGSYETNSNGSLSVIPNFMIPSDAPLGNYSLVCRASFIPPFPTSSIPNATNSYNFEVREKYNVDFQTAIVWYPTEGVMNFYLLLYTDQQIQEPSYLNLTVYDPAHHVYFQETQKSNFELIEQTNTSLLYLYEHTMPPNITTPGYHLASLSIGQGSRETRRIESFRVSQGGPYDVFIQSLESEVPRGTTQDFTIVIQNMGDVPQDVTLDYWISRNNVTYASVYGEPVFVGVNSTRSFPRSLSIYSDQPLGDYELHARVTYSSLVPSLQTYQTFRVVEANQTQPPGPGGGGGGGGGGGAVKPTGRMEVLNVFPDELLIERGGVAYVIVEVKNIYTAELYQISSFLEGVPADWFETIREIDTLAPDSTSYLIIKFKVPEDTIAAAYPSTLKVSGVGAGQVTRPYNIEIFESKEELLKARLKKTRELVTVLELKAGEVAQEGGDVTTVLSLLERANSLIDIGEKYLNENRLVETMQSLEEANNVLEQARYELSIAKPVKTKIISIVPSWIYIAFGALVIAVIIVIVILRLSFRSKVKEVETFATKKLVEAAEETKAPPTSKDLINIIKSQYESGQISKETYAELRKRYL